MNTTQTSCRLIVRELGEVVAREKNEDTINGPTARPTACGRQLYRPPQRLLTAMLKVILLAIAKYSGPGIASITIVSRIVELKSPARRSNICNTRIMQAPEDNPPV